MPANWTHCFTDMITFVGTTFPNTALWHKDEVRVINSVKQQIEQCYGHQQNLLINTTWFGPQFNNREWEKFHRLTQRTKFNNIFVMAAADPVFLNSDQIADLVSKSGAQNAFYLGHFDGPHYFNFHASILPRHFAHYSEHSIVLTTADLVFVNYNRKPRRHRTDLVRLMLAHNLDNCGVITLGQDDDNVYSEGTRSDLGNLTVDPLTGTVDSMGFDKNSQFGIVDDIHSLGNLDRWRRHLLNVVGETEFLPWDNMFISEKTWKPILGLRPFVINGQTKIYQYLRDNGFKTFNHYWSHIDVETVNETQVHQAIVAVIKYLCSLTQDQLSKMYQSMLPDLVHNRERFFQFSAEQQFKINNLFSHAR